MHIYTYTFSAEPRVHGVPLGDACHGGRFAPRRLLGADAGLLGPTWSAPRWRLRRVVGADAGESRCLRRLAEDWCGPCASQAHPQAPCGICGRVGPCASQAHPQAPCPMQHERRAATSKKGHSSRKAPASVPQTEFALPMHCAIGVVIRRFRLAMDCYQHGGMSAAIDTSSNKSCFTGTLGMSATAKATVAQETRNGAVTFRTKPAGGLSSYGGFSSRAAAWDLLRDIGELVADSRLTEKTTAAQPARAPVPDPEAAASLATEDSPEGDVASSTSRPAAENEHCAVGARATGAARRKAEQLEQQ